jgi:leucyl-tRNA synthetase
VESKPAVPETQNLSSAVAVAPSQSDADTLSHLRDRAIAESYARFRLACGQPISVAIPAAAADDASAPDRADVAWWQHRFLELLAGGAVSPPYAQDGRWTLATESTNPESLAGLRSLTGWSEPALAAQRDALDHVDGVEIKAATVDGRRLTLFVPATDVPEQGCLALMSPRHPGVGDWLSPDVAPIDDANTTGLIAGHIRPTGAVLTIDGLPRAVPLVVADGVEDHLGPTAVLVSPASPNVDGELVARLSGSAPAWSASQKRIRSRNSTRFRIPSVPISGPRAVSDVPVPVVRCPSCGAVPVPADTLPILPDSPMQVDCPSCGASAERDGDSLVFGPGGRLPWLAAETAVQVTLIAGPHGRDTTLADRAMAKALRDLQPSRCRDGEPYAVNLATGAIAGNVPSADMHDDALRFALLYAAAPATSFTWQAVDHEQCSRFLDQLGEYAVPRLAAAIAASQALPLEAFDDGAPRRRKLIGWCGTARRRITENMEQLQTHRATRNTMILLERIQAFEQRSAVTAPGNATDAAATAAALALLVRLAEPLAPEAMASIWERAGYEGPLSDVPWPG